MRPNAYTLNENFLKYVKIQLVQKRNLISLWIKYHQYLKKVPSNRNFIWKHDIRFKFLSRNIELPVYNLFDEIPFKEHCGSNQKSQTC